MARIDLPTAERTALGKRVKKIRSQGLVPGIVYGPEFDQITVQVDRRELRQVLIDAGGTQVVHLNFEDRDAVPTLVRDVQRDPIRGDVVHIDFYRVDLTKKLVTEVPVLTVGEAPLMTSGEAIANLLLNSIEVEALPDNIPAQIEVDVTDMEEIGEVITVGDLTFPEGVEAYTDANDAVVKLDYAVTELPPEEEEEEGIDLLVDELAEPEIISDRSGEEEEFEE
jgi:large subunit ribosomal protein L25